MIDSGGVEIYAGDVELEDILNGNGIEEDDDGYDDDLSHDKSGYGDSDGQSERERNSESDSESDDEEAEEAVSDGDVMDDANDSDCGYGFYA